MERTHRQLCPSRSCSPDPVPILGTEKEHLDIFLVLWPELITATCLTSADNPDWGEGRQHVEKVEEKRRTVGWSWGAGRSVAEEAWEMEVGGNPKSSDSVWGYGERVRV